MPSDARFALPGLPATPIQLVAPDGLDSVMADLPAAHANWARQTGFSAALGEACLLPDGDGSMALVLMGLGSEKSQKRKRFAIGAAIAALPEGRYELQEGRGDEPDLNELGLGYLLAQYRFDRYHSQSMPKAKLVAPSGVDIARLEAIAAGEMLTRDLINTPAQDMGPDQLEEAMKRLAAQHGGTVTTVEGDDLLAENFPMIHAVGRAAEQAPRLIEMTWGTSGPSLCLVGKGVCFDTGGLNLKPGASMGLMKKDMGGAATVLGLAHMIMSLGLNLRLHVLVPAVENNVSGNAFRPGDILTARNGKTVEINNTDAEGRLVLADALALASEAKPDLMVCMATLTGAARVAVGPDIAPFYTDDDSFASALSMAADRVKDPVWRMPFHDPYETMIEPGIADLDNAPSGGMAGSITAALFLRRFAVDSPRFVPFDIYGWQPANAPARPKGGVGQASRAILDALPEVLDL